MNPAQRAIAAVVALPAAMALIAAFEGYVPVGYKDPAPAAYPTICYGHRDDNALGKTYSADKCTELLAQDALQHGLDITRCLPDNLPTETRAAFTSAAFNLGTRTFCASSMSRKALAGDLPGACAALSLYVYAGGGRMRGLERRREAEKALCLEGLKP